MKSSSPSLMHQEVVAQTGPSVYRQQCQDDLQHSQWLGQHNFLDYLIPYKNCSNFKDES